MLSCAIVCCAVQGGSNFESVVKILKREHSNESYWAVLSCGAVVLFVFRCLANWYLVYLFSVFHFVLTLVVFTCSTRTQRCTRSCCTTLACSTTIMPSRTPKMTRRVSILSVWRLLILGRKNGNYRELHTATNLTWLPFSRETTFKLPWLPLASCVDVLWVRHRLFLQRVTSPKVCAGG